MALIEILGTLLSFELNNTLAEIVEISADSVKVVYESETFVINDENLLSVCEFITNN